MTRFFTRTRASRHLSSSSGGSLIGAALLAILVPSCALDPEGDRGPAPELADLRGTSETVTELRVTGDTTLTFFTGQDGAVAVSELAPGNAPSPLNYFVGAKRATPLEIFYSVADRSVAAPAALLADHARRVAAQGGTGELLSAEPRSLSLPKPGAEGSSLLGCDWGNCDEGTNWYYSANCSLAADGQTYFDDKWQSWGFNYHWYKSLYTDNIGWAHDYPEQSPTLYYDMFFTHLCNYTTDDYPLNHYVYWGGANQWMGAAVHEGYRHVLHLFNASGGTHTNVGYPIYGENGNFKIGVMAGN